MIQVKVVSIYVCNVANTHIPMLSLPVFCVVRTVEVHFATRFKFIRLINSHHAVYPLVS